VQIARSAESFIRRQWLAGTLGGQPVCKVINRTGGWFSAAMGEPRYYCPVCRYRGVFFSHMSANVRRKQAMCPSCGALERHRLQWLVLDTIPERSRFGKMRLLHFTPEPFFTRFFRETFRQYFATDLSPFRVNVASDICKLPFRDASFDVVYASHILEHIQDDRGALAEIHRVLTPSGIAFLPVPIFAGTKTVEYPEPSPSETYHVRQPGYDYYDRYGDFFSRVVKYSSGDFDPECQLFVHEDRTGWPTPTMPYRQPMPGEKHPDIVPVCYR